MLNANAQKWVDALRSGEYAQTQSVLCRLDEALDEPVGYCCLGVACELYRKEKGKRLTKTRVSADGARRTYDGQDVKLPWVVREWLGLTSANGYLGTQPDDLYRSLASLNDSGKSFKQIARTIESKKHRKALFGEDA